MDNNKAVAGLLKCEKCSFSSYWNFSLQNHVQNIHQNLRKGVFNCNLASIEKFPCPDCDYNTHLKVDFDNHVWRGHDWDNSKFIQESQEYSNPQEWKCPNNCAFKTFSCFLVQAHKHNCYKEEFKFNTKIEIFNEDIKVDLLQRIKEKINLKLGVDNCTKSQSNEDVLSSPYQFSVEVEPIKWFICAQCSYKARAKRYLIAHIQRKHTPEDQIKWFCCEQCRYRAKDKSSLDSHEYNQHKPSAEIKWLMCEQCPYKSKLKQGMKEHILRKHRRSGEETKWIICAQCPFRTKEQSDLYKHKIYRHSSSVQIKWFLCQKCPYKSKLERNLKLHTLRKHTPEEQIGWFVCAQCSYKSKLKYGLTLHTLRRHGGRTN